MHTIDIAEPRPFAPGTVSRAKITGDGASRLVGTRPTSLGCRAGHRPISTLLLNRVGATEFRLAADGWYHLAPLGEFVHEPTGVVQVLDARALSSMIDRFETEQRQANFPGLLVDFDHFSYDPHQASMAAGWITGLSQRTDGLWGRIRWTDAGEAAVRQGRFRLISPAWRVGDCEGLAASGGVRRLRPLRLDSVGLTNSPNFKGLTPLSNRVAAAEPAPNAFPPNFSKHKPQSKGNMQNICQALGLPADATEAAVLAEVNQLLDRAQAAQAGLVPLRNRITELEQANAGLLEAQVELDLAPYTNRLTPEGRQKWKAALLADRARTFELLSALPPEPEGSVAIRTGDGRAPMHHQAAAKHPAGLGTEQALTDAADAQRRAVQEYKNRAHCTWLEAWNALRSERPELFRENREV